jgi:hypothetical protein
MAASPISSLPPMPPCCLREFLFSVRRMYVQKRDKVLFYTIETVRDVAMRSTRRLGGYGFSRKDALNGRKIFHRVIVNGSHEHASGWRDLCT